MTGGLKPNAKSGYSKKWGGDLARDRRPKAKPGQNFLVFLVLGAVTKTVSLIYSFVFFHDLVIF